MSVEDDQRRQATLEDSREAWAMDVEHERMVASASAFQSALIVSEVRFLCDSLIELLRQAAGIRSCLSAANPVEAVRQVASMTTGLVLLDVAFPGGTTTVTQLKSANSRISVVALGVRETVEDVLAWAEAGISGYVPNTSSVRDLVSLIQQIHRGEQSCPAQIAGSLLRRVAAAGRRAAPPAAAKPLTRRELQVLDLVNAGLSNKDIARCLRISLSTTKTHVHNVLGKMQVARRASVMARSRDELLLSGSQA
jgi:two-component system, NarL family, nitrate/nitrite response regulator NarL